VRLNALDRVRGLAVLLVFTDHAAHVFYRDVGSFDTAIVRGWEQQLPVLRFLHTLVVLVTVGLLSPLCRWFRALRWGHPESFLRLA